MTGTWNGRPISDLPQGRGLNGIRGMLGNAMNTAMTDYMFANMTPEQWRGLLPRQPGAPDNVGQPPFPNPQMQNHMFQSAGPYGNQAIQMAGLLSSPMHRTARLQGGAHVNGLLGDKAQYPFNRPTGK